MTISKVEIKYFRSFRGTKFSFSNRCAIVGENNSGKSSILRALNCFFNVDEEKVSFFQGDHQYSNSYPKIILELSDLPEKEVYDLVKNNNGKILVNLTYNHGTKKYKYQIKIQNRFVDASSELVNEIRKDIAFVYIPANRDYRQVITSEKKILNKLIKVFIDNYLSQRDNITPKISQIIRLLQNNALKKLSREIDNNYLLGHKFEIKLSHIETPDYKILLEDLHLLINEKGNEFKLYQCGSGIQSIVIIALYRYLAKIEHQNIIIGIEEPELNLHPHSQKELIKFIKQNQEELQVIFTTHSTVVVDQLDHEEIILVRKEDDLNRSFKSVLYNIPIDFWTRYNIEELKWYQFYRYRNSDFFFSKFVIICESKNDAEVINYLLKQINIDIDTVGISIINLEGIKFLKYPYYLLQHLKIPYLIVLDKDFFLPYQNDQAEQSRYASGFFNYRREYKNDRFIDTLISNSEDKSELLDLLLDNHSRALDILSTYNVICFKYNLEMDLVNSRAAKEQFYNILNFGGNQRNTYNLLRNHRNQIKKLGILMRVVRNINHVNLPNSYKRIKNTIRQQVNSLQL